MTRRMETTWADKLGYAVDRAVGLVSPSWGMSRMAARTGMRSYRAAQNDRRGRGRGYGGDQSADFHDEYDRERLRSECRDAVRNDGFVKGMIRLSANNVLGHQEDPTGFQVRPKTPDEEWNQMATARLNDWARRECDVYGHQTLRDMAATVYKEWKVAGEALPLMLSKSPVSGKLQQVDAERLVQPYGHTDEVPGEVRFGIQHARVSGRPMRYWIAPYSDRGYRVRTNDGQWVHRMDMMHIFRKRRASQTRGVSELAPVLDDLEMMNQYSEAELMGAHVAACAGIWVPSDYGSDNDFTTSHPDDDGDDSGYEHNQMEPGMIYRGSRTEGEPKVINPKKPPAQYGDFFEAQARICMFALGIPLEMFSWGATSYSTARSAMLQAYRTFRRDQMFLVEHFFRPVYRWKISQFIKHGDLRPPRTEDGERADAWAHSWIIPGWEWINPLDEVRAAKMAVENGLSSWRDEVALKGKRIEDVVAENADTLEKVDGLAEKHGLEDGDKIIDREAYRRSLSV